MLLSSLSRATLRRSASLDVLCSRSSNLQKVLFSTATPLKDSYDNILVETTGAQANVGLIRLNRPKALNALSDALFADLLHAATAFDKDPNIGCLIVTGSEKAFAAGADISEMKDRTFDYTYQVSSWETLESMCWNDGPGPLNYGFMQKLRASGNHKRFTRLSVAAGKYFFRYREVCKSTMLIGLFCRFNTSP